MQHTQDQRRIQSTANQMSSIKSRPLRLIRNSWFAKNVDTVRSDEIKIEMYRREGVILKNS